MMLVFFLLTRRRFEMAVGSETDEAVDSAFRLIQFSLRGSMGRHDEETAPLRTEGIPEAIL